MARQFSTPAINQAGWGPPLNNALSNLDVRALRLGYDVREYGAAGDGTTDDQAAILAAVAAANAAGGGIVFFPAGTYLTSQTITVYSNVTYLGAGIGATTLKLKNAANVDLMATDQFATLVAGSTQGGPAKWALRDLTLDGNGANQSTASYVLSIYGRDFQVERVEVTGGKTGGVRSKWGTGGANMESYWYNTKIYNNAGVQLDWQGPHDSMFMNLIVFMDGTQTPGVGRYGVQTSGNAATTLFTNMHIWGNHEVGLYAQSGAAVFCRQSISEGAKTNVWLDTNGCQWDGWIFGTNGGGFYTGTEVGLRISHAAASAWDCQVRGSLSNWAAGDTPIDFAGDNGGVYDVDVLKNNATVIFTGTPKQWSLLRISVPDSLGLSQWSGPFGGNGAPNNAIGVVGSFYQRWDGTVGTLLYHKTGVSTWTAVL